MRLVLLSVLAALSVAGCDRVFDFERSPDAALPLSRWLVADGGALHTCGIRRDHSLWCWGRNDFGQLGAQLNGGDFEVNKPRQVGADLDWDQLAAKASTTCAIKLDHTLWCWGENTNGQIGNGMMGAAVVEPTQIPGQWLAASTGTHHTCAIDLEGAMQCWGANDWGELGDGTRAGHLTPAPALATTRFTAVGVGLQTTCALAVDQTFWCWGLNDYGEVGIGMNVTAVVMPTQVGSMTFSKLAVGDEFVCGLRTDGKLRCWGRNDRGAVGDGSGIGRDVPSIVGQDLVSDWSDVVAGARHACALHGGGQMMCWGSNEYGALLSDPTTPRRTEPQPIDDTRSWSALVAADRSTCAIDAAGELSCAGYGPAGNLGEGTGTPTAPVELPGTWSSGSAGTLITCGLLGTALSCWGKNDKGAMGDNTLLDRQVPTAVSGEFGDVVVSDHVCARSAPGLGLYCWGANDYGQLGQGDIDPRRTPVQVNPGPWQNVDVGGGHSCAINSTNLACWGANGSGQSGLSPNSPGMVVSPNQINGSWLLVGTGGYHSCATRLDKSLACWGEAGDGRLGYSPAFSTQAPLSVNLPTGTAVDEISLGLEYSCARAGTAAWCWGHNDAGQLGDQTQTNTSTPALLPKQWKQISAGDRHTCGITLQNTLWCWGSNRTGQLGDGTFIEHHDPRQVGTDGDWVSVSAGALHTCGLRSQGKLYCWGSNLAGEIGLGTAWRSTLALVVD